MVQWIYEGKTYSLLPKTKKLSFIMEKPKVIYQKNLSYFF